MVQLLQKEGISLEYLYAYISKSVDASVIFYVKDCARAEEVLRKKRHPPPQRGVLSVKTLPLRGDGRAIFV